MSKTLLRDYLDAAIDARLDKNAHQAFLVFLRQLIGFGKSADTLTDGRITQISGIRKDRVQDAVGKVVTAGLIEANIRQSGWNRYTIPASFFGGDRPTRFFAPAFPTDGETPQTMGETPNGWEHTEILPIQSSNHTDKQADPVVVCDLNPVTEIKKPHEVDIETHQKLLPALLTLPSNQANDILALVALAIRNGSIRSTPQQLGGGLIKAARNGTLDTSPLQAQQQAAQSDADKAAREAAREAREAAAERAYLLNLAKMGGISPATLGVAA